MTIRFNHTIQKKRYKTTYKGNLFHIETVETLSGEIEDFKISISDSDIDLYPYLNQTTIDGIMNNLEEE